MATLPAGKRPKTPMDCRSTQGTSVALSAGDSNPLPGQQTSPSCAGSLKEQLQGRCCRDESKTILPARDVQPSDKQLIRFSNEAKDEKAGGGGGGGGGGWSRPGSPPRTPRSKTGRGGGGSKVATLPPYIRATIAEQLAPLCTRPARENTKETLFGAAEPPSSPRLSVRRSREDTQSTLFGESDRPATVKKPTRPATDTQNNLFGPPPEFRRRQGVRFQTDTPDILRHDEGRPRPATPDARYDDRHQDTHEKLFGSPVRQPCPQVQKPLSNVFYSDPESCSLRDKVVRSLPMSSLIADE